MDSAAIALVVMLLALAAGVFIVRWPTGIALVVASILGAVSSGFWLPVRHIAEGTMLYLDPILIVVSSLFFMRVFERSGALPALNRIILVNFGRWPWLLLMLLTLFVMFPGMLTGLTAPCVLTTGAIVAPLLMQAGLSAGRAGAFIAVAAFFGMVAPPVNICAMIIGGGVDMPYIGFGIPLTIASFPLAIISSFVIASPALPGLHSLAATVRAECSIEQYTAMRRLVLILPLIVLIALIALARLVPAAAPDFGIPFVFVMCALLAMLTGNKVSPAREFYSAVDEGLPILALLAGIGVFIQVLTLTGARGLIVVNTRLLPDWLQLLGMAVLIPLFGGVSAYGSSSVFGVPFLLAMLTRNEIIAAAALSLLASVGDFLPPTRLAVVLSSSVTSAGERAILKWCATPAILAIAWGIGMVLLANPLAKLLGLN